MDSWRNRAFNKVLFRIMRQRLANCTSTLEMRDLILSIDNYGPFISAPKGMDVVPTKLAKIPCDWVDMPSSSGNKIILYFHGGGFCFHSPRIHNAFLARLAGLTKSRGLMVNYRLAPEHPYPAAPDDSFAVYRALLVKGYQPHQIFLAGDSAGGNLALTTMLRLREAKLPQPAGAIMLSPVSDMAVTGESAFKKCKDDPFFDLSTLLLMRNNYIGMRNPCEPDISPFYADLRDLPPSFITVGTEELLMDDGIRLAERMGEAGNDVTIHIAKGVPHVYPLFYQLSESREALKLMASFVNDKFKQAKSMDKKAS
ncbi:alpha/beta hydrolase [Photobacterium ganghwense]|uniref:Lipase n=2 Tax=Photobacterium ganghwense TaxID=320778 RepID=A0A0J1HCS6_9GAMM|nr:alpha/beta hydrolase [Photobacterium ganghwense]KLV09450.1 lipase [Photobacterium ganghwense]MBV1839404.1 alpha/beta hydrolase [Photobacterium ganghwense]PSU08608.1 alpha/beta hydrolase [Photobacterium ganghwense]QSV15414.1 alpha/beta hydrolase [Photobacterium ganghwense]